MKSLCAFSNVMAQSISSLLQIQEISLMILQRESQRNSCLKMRTTVRRELLFSQFTLDLDETEEKASPLHHHYTC